MKRLITRFSSVIVALALHSTVNAQCSPDLTKPTFSSCPSNMTVSASSLTGTCYYTIANQTPFYPAGSDVCTPPPLLTYQLTYFPNGQPVVGPLTNPTLTGIQLPTGTNIFVWRVIDQAGNISNPCTYNVVVNDNTAPVITCGTSGAQNVTANASCKYVVSGTSWDATATDNCTVDSVKYVLTGATTGSALTSLNGVQFNLGTTTVTWTAYDNWTTPNTSTCSYTVVVSDVTPPALTCNNTSNQSLNTDAGVCTFTRTGTAWNASATDNCSVTSVLATLTGATTGTALTTLTNQAFNVGTTVVTWTATDGSGNTTTCTFNVTITDNVAPVVTQCPINQTVNMAAGVCTYTHSGILWNPTATDNCTISYSYALSGATVIPSGVSSIAGQVFNSGVTNVLWTITDISGNTATCAYTVTVVDNQDPVITCGVTATQNITLGAGLCTYTHSGTAWNATATDNCSVAAPTYLLSGVSTGSGTTLNGQVFALGTTTVTWTATDNSGRTSTCSYDVIVTDTEEPTLVSCGPSGNQTVNMDAGVCTYTQPDASWNASFTDNCTVASTNYALTGATTGSGTSLSGIAFNYGVTTVTWTATDNSALTTTCSFTVTVNDNQVPIITCASDQPVNTDLGSCDYTKSGTDWDAVVSDNCPTIVTYALTGATSGTGGASVDGVVFQPGATTITWSVTDSHGNTSTCSHLVTVTDVELPVITTCGPGTNTTVVADAAVCTYTHAGAAWDAIATDNCTVSSIVYTLGGATAGTGATTLDNVIFNLGTTTVLWTITDNSGNTATCTYDITVDDTQNPIITCNQTTDLNLPADGGGCTLLHTGTSWDATATDNCSIATVLCDLTGATTATGLTTLDGVVFTGTTTVTWTSTDVNGLTSTCGFDITVIDSEFPVISVCGPGVNTSVTADAGVCTHTNNSTSWDIVASDNCAFTVEYSLSGATTGVGTTLNGVPFSLGTTTVLWTATDGAGNATTCTFDITVTDDEDPTITCVADQALNTDAGVCTYTIAGTALDATGSDNCSIIIDYALSGDNTGTGSSLDGVVLNPGVTNVLWTATDGSGNAVTCSYTITVTDVELPVITLCGAVIDTTVVADAGVCTYTNTGLGWDATATDNCTVSSITYQLSGVTSGTASSLDGVIFNLGVTNVLWTVTDNSGNTTTCAYNVTVLDDQLPIISTCGGSGTVIAAADAGVCTHLNTGTGLDALATDNCSITSIIYNVSGSTSGTGTTLDGFVFNPGISTVLWTVTDNSGNISTCTFDVNVPDTENPVITSCGGTGDVVVTTDPTVCTYTQTSTVWDAIATDNCVIGSYQYDLTGATTATGLTTLNGVAFNQDTTTVLWTVTDLAGNTATCTFNVIVQDNELPAITCIADQSVNTDAGVCDYTVVGTTWDPTGSDNCSTVYSYTLTGATSGTGASLDGIVLNAGITTVNWTVSDAAGNTATCSYSVTVSDAELPVITLCGAVIDTTVIADAGVCTYTNIGTGWDATATDNCTVSSIIATLSGATSGTSNTLENVLFNLGTTNVLWTVTDNSGNTTTCTFNVNVLDDQLPTVTVCGPGADVNVPTDLSVCTYTHAGIAWDATAADNCSVASIDYSLSGVTSGTGISLDGVTFNSGITSVLWTITDGSGNTTTCSYNVTVEDEEAPIIASCGGAGDTIVSADAGVCNFTNIGLGFDPTATDNCTIATVLCDLSGATSATGLTTLDAVTFNNDTTTVLWTVTDLAGNTTTCTFNVIVQDNELPLITCAADQTVIADAGVCTYTNIGTGWDALATDNCSIDSISYTLTGATVASGLTTLDGFEFELDTTLVTWTATDGAGNTTSCSFNVIVEDTELPIITCIADSTVSTDADVCTFTNNGIGLDATGTDNCSVTFDYVLTGATTGAGASIDGVIFNQGVTNILWTATDGSGNTATCSFNLTVNDTQVPDVLVCGAVIDTTVIAEATFCTYTNSGTGWDATASDNCSVGSIVCDLTGSTIGTGLLTLDGVIFNLDSTHVLWTITDAAGNTTTCSFNVIVEDTELPIITTCGAIIDTTVIADAGVCTYTNNGFGWDALATDNCSIDSISYTLTGATIASGLTTLDGVEFELDTTLVTWTATDGSGNTATCSYNVIVTDTQAPVIAAVLPDTTVECSPVAPVAADNCGPVTGISDFTTYSGDTIVVVTWTFTDASGNTATSTQTITFDDVTAPDVPVIASAVAQCDTTVSAATTSDICMGTITGTTLDPLTYSTQGTFVINWTFDDGNGNTATATQTVIIEDVTAPSITPPATVNVYPNNAGCTATGVDLGIPTTLDNCQVTSVVNNGPVVYPLGATTVTWIVTDVAGNTSSATQTVNVLPLTSTLDTVACDVYVSPDGIDLTSFGSGTYTAVIPGSFGCDSTITINLTLNQSTTSEITLSSCDSYSAPDGQVYTNSGVFTAIIPNSQGCDSTITINLTIDSIETTGIQLNELVYSADQSNVLYQWVSCENNYAYVAGATQQTFEPQLSGDYAVILTNNTCVDTSECLTIDIDLLVPQVVTPNGDGKNDVFEIQGIYDHPNNVLEIYNRWGSLVYRQEGYQNTWGGECTEGLSFGGNILPTGTYFYILDLGDNDGAKPSKGYIFLTK